MLQFLPDERDLDGVQGHPFEVTADLFKRIRVFHLHAHFDESTEKEAHLLHQVHH